VGAAFIAAVAGGTTAIGLAAGDIGAAPFVDATCHCAPGAGVD